jgi:hypothetical protein
MKIGIQNLSAIQWEAIREATGDVYQIFKSEEFRLKVEVQPSHKPVCKQNLPIPFYGDVGMVLLRELTPL